MTDFVKIYWLPVLCFVILATLESMQIYQLNIITEIWFFLVVAVVSFLEIRKPLYQFWQRLTFNGRG